MMPLMSMFFIPLVLVTGSRPHQGVVFERVGAAILTDSSWRLVAHYNLTVLQELATQLQAVVPILTQEVTNSNFFKVGNVDPRADTRVLGTRVEAFTRELESLQHSLGHPTNQGNRHTRSLIPIIGNLYSYLFGVATEDEVLDLQEQMDTITEGGTGHHAELQLSVIGSMEEQIANNTKALHSIISALNGSQQMVREELQHFSTELQQLWEFLAWTESRRRVETELAGAQHQLTLLHQGTEAAARRQLSPSVLDYKVLRAALLQVQTILHKSGRTLPFSPDDEYLYVYYQHVQVEAAVSNDDLIFVVTIPIVEEASEFMLYRVHSLPVFDSTVQQWLQWARLAPYLGIGKKGLDFMVLEEVQYGRCMSTQPIICPETLPLFSSSTPSCELGLYWGGHEHCERVVLPPQRAPVFKRAGNNWLFSTDLPAQAAIQCNSSVANPQTLVTISGTGLLEGYGDCEVQCNGVRMLGKVVGETQISLLQVDTHQPLISAFQSPNISLTTAAEKAFLTTNNEALDKLVAALPDNSVGMSLQAAIHTLEKDNEQSRLHHSHTFRGWMSTGLSSASLLAVTVLLIICSVSSIRAR
ncbi:hypothetical protein GE061_020353 [Apolygus lucorum]|uniref:Uncharacterized protein n=1 Tax=Apolygus lucorum TaxID=248454 RepID=A0A8S9WLW9_APOLU|nr:hypothetical protein GE061_020353 [Apolygus lucorum]